MIYLGIDKKYQLAKVCTMKPFDCWQTSDCYLENHSKKSENMHRLLMDGKDCSDTHSSSTYLCLTVYTFRGRLN